jgi:hypothetical protein
MHSTCGPKGKCETAALNPVRNSHFRPRYFSPPLPNIYRTDTVYPDRMQSIPMDALYPDWMLAIRGVLAGLYS